MKLFRCLLPILFSLLIVSCEKDRPATHFEMRICSDTTGGGTRVEYILSDTLLQMIYRGGAANGGDTIMLEMNVATQDSLDFISRLDVRSYDCPEQHALMGYEVTFVRNDSTFSVDPNVNHPKALDVAVRLINTTVPDKYKLEFIDMQPAIEPTGKMQI